MKAFPEPIKPALFFTSWDGRLTTEAQMLVKRAEALLQNGRHHNDTDDLRKAISVLFLYAKTQEFPRELVLLMAGIISGAIDRRIYGWAGRLFMRAVGAWLENVLAKWRGLDLDSPGWNDYVMAYWMMTGNPDAVEELFYRATEPVSDPALLPVKESAAWMVASVRRDCAEFDRAWREVETRERGAAAVEKALA
jgi:hypothetical protein